MINMSLDIQKIKHLAMLAKLELKNNEAEVYSQQLSEVLNHLDSLNSAIQEMNTQPKKLINNSGEMEMVLRKDEVV